MKRFLISVLLLSVGFLAIGCETRHVAEPAKKGIEIEFWTLQMLNFKDYMNAMIADYEAKHPGLHIHWVDVPMSEGEKKAITSMLANQTPDVINLNPDFSALLASKGTLLNMNQWVSSQQKASFLPVAWQAASLGKQTFGIPWYLSSSVTLYNRAILNKAGFDLPPKTYTDMAKVAEQVKAKTGQYLLFPTISTGGRFFRVLQKQAIPIFNAKGQLVFADHGAGEALSFWVNLYQKGLVSKESITEDNQGAVDHYQSGTLGLLLTGPNFLNVIHENAPQIFHDTAVAPQFPQRSGYTDFSEMVLVVPSRTKHPKEAVDFALYVANMQNTLKLSELAPILPPETKALEAPQFQQIASNDVVAKARSISAQQLLAAKTALQVHPMQKRLNELMDYYVQNALLGKMTPQEAMTKAQTEMNKLVEAR